MTQHSETQTTPSILQSFTQHPATVGETYGQHFMVAAKFSATLFCAAMAALVHAVLPAFFESTASRKIEELHTLMANRHSAQQDH